MGRLGAWRSRFSRPPLWVVLFLLRAALFRAGSASYGFAGSADMARLGGVGALAAVAAIVVFAR